MSDSTQQSPKDPWNHERSELVKRTICPRGISEDEFALFVEQCKRSGLDPLLKEAFCVARRQNIGNRERPNWVTKYEFQPSEGGMLARAERFPDFKGIQASAVFAEDEIIIDQGKGEVVHRFNPAKRKGSLVGAWARVVRADKLPVVVWLDFSGYVQQTPLWAKIPTTMIEKCARVAALRKAYPEAFGGLYVREEMPQEEFTPTEPEPQRPLPAATVAALSSPRGDMADVAADREAAAKEIPGPVRRALAAHDAAYALQDVSDAKKAGVSGQELQGLEMAADAAVARAREVVAQTGPLEPGDIPESKPAPSAEKNKAAVVADLRERIQTLAPAAQPPASEPATATGVVAFGPYKGKKPSELTNDELSETIDLAHEKLMEQPRAKWAKAMRSNLVELEAEAGARSKSPAPARSDREPGADV